jgi:hypothetical protein
MRAMHNARSLTLREHQESGIHVKTRENQGQGSHWPWVPVARWNVTRLGVMFPPPIGIPATICYGVGCAGLGEETFFRSTLSPRP